MFQVKLDSRNLRTPLRKVVTVPNATLAYAGTPYTPPCLGLPEGVREYGRECMREYRREYEGGSEYRSEYRREYRREGVHDISRACYQVAR